MSGSKVTIERVSASKLAIHFGVSRAYVSQLRVDNVIEGGGSDGYDQDACRLRYLDWLRDPERRAAKSVAASELQKIRTREVMLRVALAEHRLMETSDALEIIENLVGTFRAELSGLPARVTRDLAMRRTIEAAINVILEKLSDLAAARGVARKREEEVGVNRNANGR